jgi:thioredoxin-dependent peroxiredoxin
MKGMFKGGIKMAMQGNKLFTKKVKHDGHINRIGADFLLDEKGNIRIAHYGQHLGDNLPVAAIVKALEQPAAK